MRHTFQTDIQWSGSKIRILCQSEHQKIPLHPKHPRLKKHFFSPRNLMFLPAATINTKYTSDMAIVQPTEHPRTSPPGSRVSEHMPLYPFCVHLPEWAVSQSIATGTLEARKFMLERTRRIEQAWALIYFTDQPLTPCSKYLSRASTLNGTPGGDRWARFLGGQIGCRGPFTDSRLTALGLGI